MAPQLHGLFLYNLVDPVRTSGLNAAPLDPSFYFIIGAKVGVNLRVRLLAQQELTVLKHLQIQR